MKSNDKDFICFQTFYCHINKKNYPWPWLYPHDSINRRTTFRNFTWSVGLSQSLIWLYRRLRPLFFTTLLQLSDVCRHLYTALLKSSNSISAVLTSNFNYFIFQSSWSRFAAVLGIVVLSHVRLGWWLWSRLLVKTNLSSNNLVLLELQPL